MPCDVADIDPGDDTIFEAVLRADVLDLSIGGAKIQMRQPLVPPLGSRFQVRVSRDYPRMAEVVWQHEADDGAVHLGLRFVA